MAKKPFKIVNNLDLSGNELLDVSVISRSNYDTASLDNTLTVRAGSDPAGGATAKGGDLVLLSGAGSPSNGDILLKVAGQGYGLMLKGTTQAELTTNNQPFNISTGTAATVLSSTVPVSVANTGALQVKGGAYVALGLIVDGGDVFASSSGSASINLFATTKTTSANIAQYATTLNLANLATAAKTVNIATAGTAATSITVGADNVSSYVRLRGRVIHLGHSAAAATTVTVGGAVTGNTLHINSNAAGTANITTAVTTGTINVMPSVTGTVTLFKAATTLSIADDVVTTVQIGKGASTVKVGGANAVVNVGTTSGTIDIGVAGTATVFNSNATTVNAFGGAATLNIGNEDTIVTFKGATITFPNAHTVAFNGKDSDKLTISGSSATKLSLFDATQTTVNAFGAATAITVGKNEGSFTVLNATVAATNATTFTATKLQAINLGTAATAAVTMTVGKGSYATTLNLEGTNITVATSSTGTVNLFNTNALTGNLFGAATAVAIGSANSTVTIMSTKALAGISSALVVKGGAYVAQNFQVAGLTTLGDNTDDTTTIRGKVVLHDSSSSYVLQFGSLTAPILYRGDANKLTLDGHFHIAGVSSTANITSVATVDLFNTATDLKIAASTGSTVIRNALEVVGTAEIKGAQPYVLFSGTASRIYKKGELFYNTTTDTLSFAADNNLFVQLGQATYVRVKNTSGATIAKGTVVYRTGGTASVINIAKADPATNVAVIGLASHDIANNKEGLVIVQGRLDVSTTGLSGPVYLGAAGALTSTAPTETNYVVEVAEVVAAGTLYVSVKQSWHTTATFNNLRASNVKIHTGLIIPFEGSSPTDATGTMLWNTTSKKLTMGVGDARVTLVDTASEQALTNKTYEGLTLKKETAGFKITGGSSKVTTITTDFSVTTNPITLVGPATGSATLTLPDASTAITALTNGYVLIATAANTIGAEEMLSVGRGGTGVKTMAKDFLFKGNGASAVVVSNIKNEANHVKIDGTATFEMLSGVGVFKQTHSNTTGTAFTLTSTGAKTAESTAMDISFTATSSSNVKKKALSVSSTGDWTGATSENIAIFSKAAGGTTDYSFYGESGILRNLAKATFDDEVAADGGKITSVKTSFELLSNKAMTVELVKYAGSTLKIGQTGNNTHETYVYSDMTIGTAAKVRTVDHYGQFNHGGPQGFAVVFNGTDDSLDFIKL